MSSSRLSATKVKDLYPILAVGFIILTFLIVTLPKLNTAPLKSDATLAIYASQQIANGRAPYSNYIIMHPPIPHLLGAVVIRLGRMFNIFDDISIKWFCLTLSVAIIFLAYGLGKKLDAELGALAALAASWNLTMLMTIWGMHVKLVMLLFYMLALWSLMNLRWFWAGLFLGIAVLSWGGGLVLLGVALLVWFFGGERSWKSLWQFVLGMLIVAITVGLLLILSGSFIDFIHQYLQTFEQYVINKISGRGIRDPGIGLPNIFRSANLSTPDIFILFAGLAGFMGLLVQMRTRITENPALLTGASAALVGCGLVVFDFQSPFDLLPLLAALSIFAAWGIKWFIQAWVRVWNTEYSPIYIAMVILALSVIRMQVFQPVSDRLADQRTAATWLIGAVENQYPIQAFGELSVLVLGGETNALPVIHAGPKTFLAMNNLGWNMDALITALGQTEPGLVFIDNRNTKKDYLNALNIFLEENYALVGVTSEPTTFVYANNDLPNATRDAIVYFQFNHPQAYSGEHGALLIPPEEMAHSVVVAADSLDDSHILLTVQRDNSQQLVWWSQPESPQEGTLAFRYLSTELQPETAWKTETAFWLPGFSSRLELTGVIEQQDYDYIELCIAKTPSVGAIECDGRSVIIEASP